MLRKLSLDGLTVYNTIMATKTDPKTKQTVQTGWVVKLMMNEGLARQVKDLQTKQTFMTMMGSVTFEFRDLTISDSATKATVATSQGTMTPSMGTILKRPTGYWTVQEKANW